MFPSLVNCCTIDWFAEWPADALKAVADFFLGDIDMDQEELDKVVETCITFHQSTATASEKYLKLIEGDSFGEEILFNLEEAYTYTIVALTDCVLHSISEDGFKDRFRNMPELRDHMYIGFLKARKAAAEAVTKAEKQMVVEREGRKREALGTESVSLHQDAHDHHGDKLHKAPTARTTVKQGNRPYQGHRR